ncbi:NAD-dependent epimerase/dehydratase family protein [Plantactinospora solaniradicis]|uniref:NAD-dependent epimerase/dehydratase family protein n=1 Tax=Plantactinospora solaniradicis TaxID=1723736 RepID=A0ABW1KNC6_9ACTN
MRSALVIGGTGLVGRAVARRLLSSGWRVTVTGRDPGRVPADLAAAGARLALLDRDDPAGLAAVGGDGCDLLVDCVCYTAAQARLVLPLIRNSGSAAMISSRAVYVDDEGNHVNSASAPRFTEPVTEQQPTMKPGDMPYNSPQGYGANKVAAEQVLLDSGLPVTVLRPSKVHGQGAAPPREWYFVKRALDRRPTLLLAGRGRGADHPSAAVNIAALVEVAAERPGRRILNAADPDVPDALTISRVIAALTGHTWHEILLDDDAPPQLGNHPWRCRAPAVLDTSAARALGYRPVGDYATTASDVVDWLLDAVSQHPAWMPPGVDDMLATTWFDYASEDAWLRTTVSASRTGGTSGLR